MRNATIKILILDDEPFMFKLLVRMLENLGYLSVFACASGEAALKLIDDPKQRPELILLDINMPGMDGLEFVRHLVGRHYTGSIILISGEDERMQEAAEKLARAHKITVLGHLHKPASPEGLAALIEKSALASREIHQTTKKAYSKDELRAAINDGELVNYYQPKVIAATGRVMGVEALVRWHHPQDGIVLPEQFISLAEESGLIDDLTQVVLTNAFAQSKLWQEAGVMLHMAINLSMDNLASLGFLDLIVDLASKAGVPPQMVIFEVTESRLVEDLRTPLEILSRLRLKRFRVSIDDFGIGHSSLAQLRDMPFDELKIDQSFVHGAHNNEKLWAMFDSCLNLGRQLRMDVTAEGIEDRADWDFVRGRACDIAQGFFIAKPMPAADIPAWIESWHHTYPHSNKRI